MSREESLRKYNSSEKGKATQLRYRRTKKGKALSRRAKLKYYYGLTDKDYTQLLRKQEGGCAICKLPQSNFKRRLDIDHDHTTGEVRGLLCSACNRHLGIWELGGKRYKPELVQGFQRYIHKENFK